MESVCGDACSNDRESFCGPSFRMRRRAAVFKARKEYNSLLDTEGSSDTDDFQDKSHNTTNSGEVANRAEGPQRLSAPARMRTLSPIPPPSLQLLLKSQLPPAKPPQYQPSTKVQPPPRVFSHGRVRQRIVKSKSSDLTSLAGATENSSAPVFPPDKRIANFQSQTDTDTSSSKKKPDLKLCTGTTCQRLSHHRKEHNDMAVEVALAADGACRRLSHSCPTKKDAPIDYMAVYHRLRMGRFGNFYKYPFFAGTPSSSTESSRSRQPLPKHRTSGTSHSACDETRTNVTHLLQLLRKDFGLQVGAAVDVSTASDSNVAIPTYASDCKASTLNSFLGNETKRITDEPVGTSQSSAYRNIIATLGKGATAGKVASTEKVSAKANDTGTRNFVTLDNRSSETVTKMVADTVKILPTQNIASDARLANAEKLANNAKVAPLQNFVCTSKDANAEKVALTGKAAATSVTSSNKNSSDEIGDAKLVVGKAARWPVPKPRRTMFHMSQSTTITTWSETTPAPGVSVPSHTAPVSLRSNLPLSVANCGPFASAVVCNSEPFESARSFRLSPRLVAPQPVDTASIGWRRVRYRCADLRIHQRLSLTCRLQNSHDNEVSSRRWLSSSALLTQLSHPCRVELSAQVWTPSTDTCQVALTSHQDCDTTWYSAAEVAAPSTRFAFQAMKRRRLNRHRRAHSRYKMSRREKTTNCNFYSVPVC